MRRFVALAIAVLMPSAAHAVDKIQFFPNQEILACPNIKNPKTPAVVCNANILVGGGQVASGYSFSVKPGTTLPPGVFLVQQTGVITIDSDNSKLPAAGQVKTMNIVASDGGKSGSGKVNLRVQNTATCGCPVFQVMAGPIPLPAHAGQPYAVTLSVVGPSSYYVLRPNYSWKLRKGSTLPPGLFLDASRGVLRGTPTTGGIYNFYVDVTEKNTKEKAISTNQYTLLVM